MEFGYYLVILYIILHLNELIPLFCLCRRIHFRVCALQDKHLLFSTRILVTDLAGVQSPTTPPNVLHTFACLADLAPQTRTSPLPSTTQLDFYPQTEALMANLWPRSWG